MIAPFGKLILNLFDLLKELHLGFLFLSDTFGHFLS